MPNPGRTALYRLYDVGGELLYVGITGNVTLRMSQHSHDQLWWPSVNGTKVKWFSRRDQAEKAESTAIRREKPLHNRCRVAALTRRIPRHDYEYIRRAKEEVAQRLMEDMAAGVYEPGLRLSRPELAERYGVAILVISLTLQHMGRRQGVLREHGNRYYVPDAP